MALRWVKICMLGALAVLHGACATLPPATSEAGDGWRILANDKQQRVLVRKDVTNDTLRHPRLGQISYETPADAELAAELKRLSATLDQQLRDKLPAPAPHAPLLNLRISDPQPVSPALNAASILLLFVPLDRGALTIEAELINDEGQSLALWQERVSGTFGLAGSLSSWDKLQAAASVWAERCAQQPPWLTTATPLSEADTGSSTPAH